MNITLDLIDYIALSPFLILLIGALLLLLIESFTENFSQKISMPLTCITFLCALFALFRMPVEHNTLLTNWLSFDHSSFLFSAFFICIGLAVTLLSSAFFERFQSSHGEYYFLLVSATVGLMLIGASADFLTLFIGLETLSISLYVLCGYIKRWELSHESALKYFLMGALASALLLYGIALVYGAVGTTQLANLLTAYQSLNQLSEKMLFLGGIALITLGFAFKAAVVPFHVWAPDAYDGAPTPVTAFMSVGTKVGAFAAFVRVFLLALPNFNFYWNEAITWLAYLTLIYANLVAMRQVQLRRFFAYSGISHAGFLLIPLAAITPDSFNALVFYLVTYSLATLGAFSVLAFLDHKSEGVLISDLRGLFYKHSFLALILTLCLLTLAGIPPTVGFFAKLYIFKVAIEAHSYGLVIVGLMTTILAAYYYLRIVVTLFAEPHTEVISSKSWQAGILGTFSVISLIFISLFPNELYWLIAP